MLGSTLIFTVLVARVVMCVLLDAVGCYYIVTALRTFQDPVARSPPARAALSIVPPGSLMVGRPEKGKGGDISLA